jgi:shikimate kinase
MAVYKRIFVIGHSGAGKGVLAAELAKELNWKFINADIMGSSGHIGRKLSEVIGKEGEKALYNCQHEILSHLRSQENIVVTTDESVICSDKCRELLELEFTVFLEVSTSVQVDRLSSYRPLLPVKDFHEFLDKMHTEFDDSYKKVSSFSLSSDDGKIAEHVKSVLQAMK